MNQSQKRIESEKILRAITHTGLRRKRFKNSRVVNLEEFKTKDKQGIVFGFSGKENMQNARGIVFGSLEALIDNQSNLTHWTPNIYGYGKYSDHNRSSVAGWTKENLRQINAFVVDLDYDIKEELPTPLEVEMVCIDELGTIPNIIIKTDKGYHLYFLLEKPCYVSNKNNLKNLKIAEQISQSIRLALLKKLPVDMACRHFGIFRFPSRNQLIPTTQARSLSFEEWIEKSKEISKEMNIEFKIFENRIKPNLKVIQGVIGNRQIDQTWYQEMLQMREFTHVKHFNRNNAIFTLALANKSSGVVLNKAKEALSTFNANLKDPLEPNEVEITIQKAYEGKYIGASNRFVQMFVPHAKSTLGIWHKHKRRREYRKNSHLHEWESDLIEYLKANTEELYLRTTLQNVSESTGIPLTSLKRLLKKLSNENILFLKTKKGKGGKTILALKEVLIEHAMERKETGFLEHLTTLFPKAKEFVLEMIGRMSSEAPRARGVPPALSG